MKHFAVCLTAFLFLLISSFVATSCSDAASQVTGVTAVMVFDFADTTSEPAERLSLFAETDDVQRVKSIRAVHEKSGIEWNVQAPRKIGGHDSKTWAGYTNLVPASGSTIPQGKYQLIYEDAAEHESDVFFNVSYPLGFPEKRASDFPAAFMNGCVENIALYSPEGSLIFYGRRKTNWKDDAAIANEYSAAQTMRICYTSVGGAVVCMMPPVKINDIQSAAAATAQSTPAEEGARFER